ncbi:hypothetical protein [Endobacterium cereale]|uniref:hypothetical protein n=1 Tax=Endobacterium cereale TaxID=2663029 RepID=UPI002B4702A9|nr:hypothetical protein [Endobacterium cereale]MEB2844004.1 hypothetical protein [Endobacterium cereale]
MVAPIRTSGELQEHARDGIDFIQGRVGKMTFGKLGSSDPDRKGDVNLLLQSNGSDKWGFSLADVGIGLSAMLVVFSGTYFFADDMIAVVKPAQAARQSHDIFAYEPEPRARAYRKDVRVDPIFPSPFNMVLKMNVTAEGFDAVDSELHERCLKRIDERSARYAEVHGKVPVATQTAAQFIACSMRNLKSRFCEKPHKDRLVARLGEFIRVQRAFAAEIKKIAQTPQGQMMMNVAEMSARNGKGALKSGRLQGPIVPPVLAEQLQALSEVALLSQADFNKWPIGEVPEELKPYLKAEAGPSPCV